MLKQERFTVVKGKDLKKLKEKLAALSDKSEKNQQELDNYINSLKDDEVCKYMNNMRDIINLCNNHLFECKFKSKERFRFEKKIKPECRREDVLRLKRIL